MNRSRSVPGHVPGSINPIVVLGLGAVAFVACSPQLTGEVATTDSSSVVSALVTTSGTATLAEFSYSRGGYDFATRRYSGFWAGDLYFGAATFWANNGGMNGLVWVGPCNSVDGVTNIPNSGYSRFGVEAKVGSCYVSLTHDDTRDHAVFRVDELTDTTVSITWRLIPSGNWGARLVAERGSAVGYDFATRTYFGASGGDFYLLDETLWANNTGQNGVAPLGPCDDLDSVASVPTSAGVYQHFGVALTEGHCYAIRTRDNRTVVARADEVWYTMATLTWRPAISPTGTLQITAASRSPSSVSCTVFNNGIAGVSRRSRSTVTFTAGKFGLRSSRVVTAPGLTAGETWVAVADFSSGGTAANPAISDLSGYELTCAAEAVRSGSLPSPPPIVSASRRVQSACAESNSLTADVDCWLGRHPNVAQHVTFEWLDRAADGVTPVGTHVLAWHRWTPADRAYLRAVFAYYVDVVANNGRGGLGDPDPLPSNVLANLVQLTDGDPAVTIVSDGDAWKTFIRYVAMSLAVEMNHAVPWTIVNYDTEALASLFDSRHTFSAFIPGARAGEPGGTFGLFVPGHFGNLTLTNPVAGHLMVANNYDPHTGLYDPDTSHAAPMWDASLAYDMTRRWVAGTKLDTIANAIEWSKRLQHFYNVIVDGGSFSNTLSVVNNWQVRGAAPVYLTLVGTVNTPYASSLPDAYHYTAGCHGTSGLLGSLLRTVNIPVENARDAGVGHSLTHFMGAGVPDDDLYLSHGDDPYIESDPNGIPTTPWAGDLLITASQYYEWFVAGGDNLEHARSLGRGAAEAMIKGLTGRLLAGYCQDVSSGVFDHTQSNVLGPFRLWASLYPVWYLEDLPPVPGLPNSLWDRLAQKVEANGGCAAVISSLNAAAAADRQIEPPAERLNLSFFFF